MANEFIARNGIISKDNSIITGSLNVTGGITGSTNFNTLVNRPTLVSGSSQITYSGISSIPSGIVSGSSQITYSGLTGIPAGIVSGSSQITLSSTTGYVANQHIDHSSVSISAGSGLVGGGNITATRTLSIDTGSTHFLDGVKKELNTEGVISGSSQVIISSTTGYTTFSGSLKATDDSLSSRISAIEGGSVGTFATTGSNTFVGNQTIYGTLTQTSSAYIETIFERAGAARVTNTLQSTTANAFTTIRSFSSSYSPSARLQLQASSDASPLTRNSVLYNGDTRNYATTSDTIGSIVINSWYLQNDTALGYIGYASVGNSDIYLRNATATGGIRFQTVGVERMYIASSGNVGIGTTSPDALLDVNGDALINGNTVGNGSGNQLSNTVFGYIAFNSNGTGLYNTAIGQYALRYNTSGSSNTAIGASSLQTSSVGSANTSIGVNSMLLNTSGSNNTSMGYYALASNTTQGSSTAIGVSSQRYISSSQSVTANTSVGVDSLRGSGTVASNTGYQNTAIGYASLRENTSGFQNTGLGYAALLSNTSGNYNTAIGNQSMYSNTTGYSNSTIGFGSLYYNISGIGNNAIGYVSLYDNTTGNYNNAIGFNSLTNNTTGNGNTAIGHNALLTNTTQSYSTAVGYESQKYILSSISIPGNTSIGYQSLVGNVTTSSNTGYYNTAIGQFSLMDNTSGYGNIAVGYAALIRNTIGYNNISIGSQAGQYAGSGTTSNTDSNSSIYIGTVARAGSNGNTNEIVIGNNTVGLGSNTTIIGNSSTITTALYGNVGIGTTSPSSAFQVVGATKINNTAYYEYNTELIGPSTASGSILKDSTLSDVTTTTYGKVYRVKLVTTGTGTSTGEVWIAQNPTGSTSWSVKRVYGNTLTPNSNWPYMTISASLPVITHGHPTGNYAIRVFSEEITLGNLYANYGVFGLDESITAIGDYVGIGTQTPVGRLHISSSDASTLFLERSGFGRFQITPSSLLTTPDLAFAGAQTSSGFWFRTVNASGVSVDAFTIRPDGKVGIGINNPSALLHTNGDAIINGNTIGNGGGNVASNFAAGNNSLLSNLTGGNNTAVGVNSMYYNTGNSNTAIGNSSLYYNTSGLNNVGVGYQPLYYNLTGGYNIAIGNGALLSNRTQNYSVAIGHNSQYYISASSTTTGNTSVGSFSLQGSTTSSLNTATHDTAIGYAAMLNTTSGGTSVAVGSQAMYSNTEGVSNVAVGYLALYNNTTQDYSTAIGFESQRYISSSNLSANNTSVGFQSLRGSTTVANNTGYENTSIGYGNMYTMTSGYRNTSIGYASLYAMTAGYENIAIGYYAGRFITNGSTANATSNRSIYIGRDTRARADGDTNEIVIGDGAIGLGSNTTTIGNTSTTATAIYGDLLLGTTIDNGLHKLQIVGNALITGSITSSADILINGNTIGNGGGNVSTNFAAGNLSLNSNTSGTGNIAVGNGSLTANLTGNSNTVLGYYALASNTSQSGTTAVGYYSQRYISSSQGNAANTSLGYQALMGSATPANNTGYQNVAIGYAALQNNTTGYQNTAIGYASLLVNTTGYQNTALGNQTLSNNTTGIVNVAIGYGALNANTSGSNNSAVGWNALYNNTTGVQNSALGVGAVGANTTGTNNTGVGYRAVQSNTTGFQNTGVGSTALYSNTTGILNTGVGVAALNDNTTGTHNTGVGWGSLLSNTTGTNNVGIGYQAGRYTSNFSTPNTASHQSIYIGAESKAANAATTNEIVIGFGTNGIGSNTTAIGNLSTSTTALYGNVGIGTTSPSSTLNIVNGNQNIQFGTGTNTSGYTFTLGVNDDGVNFSNNSTGRGFNFVNGNGSLIRLDSSANLYFAGSGNSILTNTSDGADNKFVKITAGGVASNTRGAGAYFSGNEETNTGRLQLWSGNVTGNHIRFDTNGLERVRIDSTGNVGVGTTTPSTLMHIAGASGLSIIRMERTNPLVNAGIGAIGWSNTQNYITSITTHTDSATTSSGYLAFRTGTESSSAYGVPEQMRLTSNGNLLIGTTTEIAGFDLQIAGDQLITTTTAPALTISGMTAASTSSAIVMSGFNTKGGAAYFDFLAATITTGSATNPSKFFRLDRFGSLQIINNAYTTQLLELTDSGGVTINGSLTMPNRPAFRVTGSSAGTTLGTNAVLSGSAAGVDYNQGSAYNTTNGQFTVPIAGLYHVYYNGRTNVASLSSVALYKNGAGTPLAFWESNANTGHFGVSSVVKLSVNDVITAKVTAGSVTFDVNDSWGVAYIG